MGCLADAHSGDRTLRHGGCDFMREGTAERTPAISMSPMNMLDQRDRI